MKGGNTYNEFQIKTRMLIIKLIHFLLSIGLFVCAWTLFRYHGIPERVDVGFRYNIIVAVGYAIVLYFLNRTYGAYLVGFSRIRMLLFAQFLAQFFAVVIVYIVVSIAWYHFDSPLALILLLIPQLILDAAWSYLSNYFYFKFVPVKNTILVYRNELDRKRFGSISGKPSERVYKVTKELRFDGEFQELEEQLAAYDAIFVAGVNSRCRNGILKYCKEMGVDGFFLPHVGDVIMRDAKHIKSFSSPVMNVGKTVLNPEYAFVKRAFDVFASGLAIVLLSPTLLVTALAIRLYDGGPAIYKQVRLTKDGKEFKILKFRSMRVDAEKDGVARLSTGDNDDRITPIGSIIRKCRLDELPQLFNIFKGDMSVVGPRPERPEIAEQYYRTIPEFRLRLQVKAGLTGYAQVYGKYNTDPYEKLQFDLLYINDMNILTDLMLIFATVAIVFLSESTEGVAAGQETAMNPESEEESVKAWEE